jgi:hypothetical protein
VLFRKPTSLTAALAQQRAKTVVAVAESTGSAEIAQWPADIRRRAFFSARTPYIEHLAQIDSVIGRILEPGAAAPGESVNNARARELLRESLRAIGYSPDQVGAATGALRDLASERRLNLIVDISYAYLDPRVRLD